MSVDSSSMKLFKHSRNSICVVKDNSVCMYDVWRDFILVFSFCLAF